MNSTVDLNVIYDHRGRLVPLDPARDLGNNVDSGPAKEVDTSGKTVYNTGLNTLRSEDVHHTESTGPV
jgi:hypothetical protein